MAAKRSELTVLTANRLGDGRVVYLTGDGDWATRLDAAALVRTEEDAARAQMAGEQAVSARHVVEPYLIDVEFVDDGVRPARLRERIRAEGPTTGSSRPQSEFAKAS